MSKLKAVADDELKVAQMMGVKTLWEKKKIQVASIHAFFQKCLQNSAFPVMFNPFPDDKSLAFKLKAFAVDNFFVAQNVLYMYFFERVENIVGKGENAGYQHFLLSLQCFQNVFNVFILFFLIGVIKSCNSRVKG